MIKKIKKENKLLIVICILFLSIAFLSPLSGDDWGNYHKYDSLLEIFKSTFYLYKTWEGRIVSRFLINVLTYNKIIWNILLPVCITSLIIAINNFSNKDKKYNIFLLSILGLLIINNTMFAQVYTWVAGSITYLYPTVIIFSYFSFLFTNKKKLSKSIFIALILINTLCPMFVENIGVALVFGNVLYLLYYFIMNKKIDIKTLVFVLISLLSLIIMLKSPGSMQRMALDSEFNKFNFLEKILYNKYNLMNYTYTRNPFVVFLMIIPIFLVVFSKVKDKKIRIISKVLFLIIPILTIINSGLSLIKLNLNIIGIDIENNMLCFIYWIGYTILFITSILLSKMDKEDILSTLFMYLIGASSICSLLVTPVFGDRASYFTVIVFIAVSLKLISHLKIDINDKVMKLLKIILALVIVFYIVVFIVIFILNLKREQHIKNELNKNSNIITISSNPIPYLWNNNPSTEFHIETFKQYYKIPSDVELIVKSVI